MNLLSSLMPLFRVRAPLCGFSSPLREALMAPTAKRANALWQSCPPFYSFTIGTTVGQVNVSMQHVSRSIRSTRCAHWCDGSLRPVWWVWRSLCSDLDPQTCRSRSEDEKRRLVRRNQWDIKMRSGIMFIPELFTISWIVWRNVEMRKAFLKLLLKAWTQWILLALLNSQAPSTFTETHRISAPFQHKSLYWMLPHTAD